MSEETAAAQGSDGFVKVVYKRKGKKKMKYSHASMIIEPLMDGVAFSKKVIKIKAEFTCSKFLQYFLDTFFKSLRNTDLRIKANKKKDFLCTDTKSFKIENDESIDIVCYGLGNFLSCVIAQYQLVLLMILIETLKSVTIYIYDPVFSIEEKDFLTSYGFTVLNSNEEGKRTIEKFTVFFMPHCGKSLYNSVLFANWSVRNLSRLLVIGNSFKNCVLSTTDKYLMKHASYLYNAEKFVSEEDIQNVFTYTDIFNDLSIHHFKKENLVSVSSDMWEDLIEPEYTDDDDLIRNK